LAQSTHDTAEDGFHEIYLSGKQLVFLFMTATVVLGISFLCGVQVGRNLPGADRVEASTLAAAEYPAPEATEQPLDPPPPDQVVDNLTYDKELRQKTTSEPPERRPEPSAPAPTPPPTPAPAASAAVVASDVPTSGRAGKLVVQVFASKSADAASSVVKQLAAKGYPAFLVPPAANDTPPMYRVQVGRYNDRREA
jgi:cell division septation protein DedD